MRKEQFEKNCERYGTGQIDFNKRVIEGVYQGKTTVVKNTSSHKVIKISDLDSEGFQRLKEKAKGYTDTYTESNAYVKDNEAYIEIHLKTVLGNYGQVVKQNVKQSLAAAEKPEVKNFNDEVRTIVGFNPDGSIKTKAASQAHRYL